MLESREIYVLLGE